MGISLLKRVNLAMAQVARNIKDPDTDPEKARNITITLTFKPDKSRRHVKTLPGVNITQAPPLADETMMLVGRDLKTGRIEMIEYGSNQPPVRIVGSGIAVQLNVIICKTQARKKRQHFARSKVLSFFARF